MSSSTLVAKRYANALFMLAQEQKNVAKTESDLNLVASVLSKESQLMTLLEHPSVDLQVKRDLIVTLFSKLVDINVLNTLQLMCDRRRTSSIVELASYFSTIAGRELGQVNAQVYSATTLTEQELADVKKKFTELLGKEVRLQQTEQPELIGGIQVRVGDTLYDGSIAGKLARLEKALQQTQA